jgi:ribosomal protein L7/L12
MTNTATAIITVGFDRTHVDLVDNFGCTPLVFTDSEGVSWSEAYDRLAELGWTVDRGSAQALRANTVTVRLRRTVEGKIARIKRVRAVTTLIDLRTAKNIVEALDALGPDADRDGRNAAVARLLKVGYDALPVAERLGADIFARGLIDGADL